MVEGIKSGRIYTATEKNRLKRAKELLRLAESGELSNLVSQTLEMPEDLEPSNSTRATQEWLRKQVPRFISSAQWPTKSSHTNPLDYCVWSIFESEVGTKKYQSVDHLKQALLREWAKIPQSNIRTACDGFIGRLKAIIRVKADQFEQI